MAKNADILFNAVIAFIALGVLYVLYRFIESRQPPTIHSIHVINLDRDTKRWESIQTQANQLGLTVNRFKAIYGKDIPYHQMRVHGVGNAMVRADRNDHKGEKLHNLGVVGCYLSHRALIEQLGTMNVPDSYGHLILEDDAHVPEDLLSGKDTWSTVSKHIPTDWDIVYLGMGGEIESVPIADKIVKLMPNKNQYDTHAYLVKHGSIKTKLLPALRFMTDAIDNQYNSLFNDLNVYCIYPNIIVPDEEVSAKSTILAIN
jgi:glycosyl transferase family 25